MKFKILFALDSDMGGSPKDRLAMTHADKLEGAWRLTVLDVGSKRDVADATGAGERTIATMRETKRVLMARGGQPYLNSLSWSDAKDALKGEERKEFDDSARAAWSRECARRITKEFGNTLQTPAGNLRERLGAVLFDAPEGPYRTLGGHRLHGH
jgi:hypothetical protein